jgi:hypothetical protein
MNQNLCYDDYRFELPLPPAPTKIEVWNKHIAPVLDTVRNGLQYPTFSVIRDKAWDDFGYGDVELTKKNILNRFYSLKNK